MCKNGRYSLAVIITSYNKDQYLSECIQSVLQQTLLPQQIFVVDDCSSDSSRDIIDSFCNKNDLIKGIYLEKNSGVSHARNVGMRCAETEYIAFLDGDDFYANPQKLENEMNLIQTKGDEIVAYSRLLFAEADGTIKKEIANKRKDYLTGNIFSRMLTGRFQWPAIARDYCVKKSVVMELGGYNEIRNLYEDLELLLKLAKHHTFLCTFEPGSAYRQVGNGLSNRDRAVHQKNRKEIFDEMIEEYSFLVKAKYVFLWNWNKVCRWIEQNCVRKLKSMVKTIIGRK